MAVIVAVLVALGAGLWYAGQNLSLPTFPDNGTAQSQPAPAAPPQTGEPKRDFPMEPEPAPSDTAAVEPTPVEGRDDGPGTGRGKITGTITMTDGAAIPGDLVLALHRIDEEEQYNLEIETLHASLEMNGAGEFEFTDLPISRYALFATSQSHTGTNTWYLSKERPDREGGLDLYPASTISGIVVNAAGEGIPHAQLFVAGYLSGGNETRASVYRSRGSKETADETGGFVMDDLQIREPPLQYRLLALAEGHGPTVTDLIHPGTSGVQIVLGEGGSVSGRLVNQDTNEGVADAKISFTTNYALSSEQQTTEDDGSFTFDGLSAGSHKFALDDDALIVTSDTQNFELTQGRTIEDLIVYVREGAVVTGRMYDADTKRGIAGAEIYAYPENGRESGARSRETKTDASGNFKLVGLGEATYRVQYRDVPGYSDENEYNDRKEIASALGKTFEGLDFELSKGLSIAGRVVDVDGRGIDKVRLYGNASGNSRARDSAETDSNGRFTLFGYEQGDKVRIQAMKQTYGRLNVDAELTEGPLTGFEIVLETEATVSGILVDAGGSPAGGSNLYARSTEGRRMSSGTAQTGGDGAFKLTGLSAGSFDIALQQSEHMYGSADPVLDTVVLESGEQLEGVRLALDKYAGEMAERYTITGRIVDDLGQPVSRATAYGWDNNHGQVQASSGPDGKFVVANLKKGKYNLNFSHREYMSANNRDVEAGETDMHVVMTRAGIITGTVVDPSRNPVTEFQMLLYRNRLHRSSESQLKRIHDAEGAFSLTNANPKGNNIILVRAEGYAEKHVPIDGVRPGETISNVVIQLDPEAALTGLVVDESGNPVRGASIYKDELPRGQYELERNFDAKTDAEGRFELTGLPGGEMIVAAYKQGLKPESVTVNVAGRNNDVRIILSTGAMVTGTVTVGASPAADARVSAHIQIKDEDGSHSNFSSNATTDENGYYEIAGLPDGNGSLNASIRIENRHRSRGESVEVKAGLATVVDFDFPGGGATIEGYLYDEEGKPTAGNVSLNLTVGDKPEYQGFQTKEDGFYQFDTIPAGQYILTGHDNRHEKNDSVTGTIGDNESLLVDLQLKSKVAVIVDLNNYPQQGHTIAAAAIPGVHEYEPNMTLADWDGVARQAMDHARIENGQLRFQRLYPGDYTIVAFARDNSQAPEPDSTMRIAHSAVTLNAGGENRFTLSFPN
jgi:hypothetical protein